MNLQYHISATSLTCPHCDKEIPDYYDQLPDVGSRGEIECESCGKNFWGEAHYAFDSYSDCELNDIEHDWDTSESHPTVHNCENCSQCKVDRAPA